MSKSDFEFYEIPSIEGEFVVPKLANDPYKGIVHPRDAGQLAINQLVAAAEETTGKQTSVHIHGSGVSMKDYFFSRTPVGTQVAIQRLEMVVDLDDDDTYYSKPMNSLAAWLSTGSILSLMPEQPDDLTEKASEELRVMRESAAVEDYTALYDREDQPTDPTIIARQIVPVRAYRWLPGPIRKSPAAGQLPPAHNVRPVPVAIVQKVEITGLNPRVQR